MRGKADSQVTMLSLVNADQLLPEDHPIRQIKPIADNALRDISPTFSRMYDETGRPSIPPEHLLKACLLISMYSGSPYLLGFLVTLILRQRPLPW
jgi:transposase